MWHRHSGVPMPQKSMCIHTDANGANLACCAAAVQRFAPEKFRQEKRSPETGSSFSCCLVQQKLFGCDRRGCRGFQSNGFAGEDEFDAAVLLASVRGVISGHWLGF